MRCCNWLHFSCSRPLVLHLQLLTLRLHLKLLTAATTVADRETNESFGSTFSDYVARNGGTIEQIAAATAASGPVDNTAAGQYSGDYPAKLSTMLLKNPSSTRR